MTIRLFSIKGFTSSIMIQVRRQCQRKTTSASEPDNITIDLKPDYKRLILSQMKTVRSYVRFQRLTISIWGWVRAQRFDFRFTEMAKVQKVSRKTNRNYFCNKESWRSSFRQRSWFLKTKKKYSNKNFIWHRNWNSNNSKRKSQVKAV